MGPKPVFIVPSEFKELIYTSYEHIYLRNGTEILESGGYRSVRFTKSVTRYLRDFGTIIQFE